MGLALLFPGQGSQVVGMGSDLAAAYPEARRTFEEADDLLRVPLSRVVWEGPEEALTLTKNAQPALLVHSVAVHRILEDRLPAIAMAAGHSLGEFTAHVAAGTLSFADAVRAVRLRGELMHDAGEARPGAMAAVLGMDDEGVVEVCEAASDGSGRCVPANFNSPGQVVISGDVDAVERGMELAREGGAKRVVELKVSGAFHSPLMEPAEAGLRDHLDSIEFSDPSFPVVANVTAEPVVSADDARRLLVDQLTAPVRWTASIARMLNDGVDAFLELGPGKVLCGLNRRNARGIPCRAVGQATDVDSYGVEA